MSLLLPNGDILLDGFVSVPVVKVFAGNFRPQFTEHDFTIKGSVRIIFIARENRNSEPFQGTRKRERGRRLQINSESNTL